MPIERRPPTKGSWRGKKTDTFWTKSTRYGQRYKCSECGKDSLGLRGPARMHWNWCSRHPDQVPPSP